MKIGWFMSWAVTRTASAPGNKLKVKKKTINTLKASIQIFLNTARLNKLKMGTVVVILTQKPVHRVSSWSRN
jgi:hypothetical protein